MEDLPESEDLPNSETELIAATKRLIALMTDNPKFANAPVSVDELRRQLDAFIKARNAEDVAHVAAIQAKAAADKARNALLEAERKQAKVGGGSSAPPILWN